MLKLNIEKQRGYTEVQPLCFSILFDGNPYPLGSSNLKN